MIEKEWDRECSPMAISKDRKKAIAHALIVVHGSVQHYIGADRQLRTGERIRARETVCNAMSRLRNALVLLSDAGIDTAGLQCMLSNMESIRQATFTEEERTR